MGQLLFSQSGLIWYYFLFTSIKRERLHSFINWTIFFIPSLDCSILSWYSLMFLLVAKLSSRQYVCKVFTLHRYLIKVLASEEYIWESSSIYTKLITRFFITVLRSNHFHDFGKQTATQIAIFFRYIIIIHISAWNWLLYKKSLAFLNTYRNVLLILLMLS